LVSQILVCVIETINLFPSSFGCIPRKTLCWEAWFWIALCMWWILSPPRYGTETPRFDGHTPCKLNNGLSCKLSASLLCSTLALESSMASLFRSVAEFLTPVLSTSQFYEVRNRSLDMKLTDSQFIRHEISRIVAGISIVGRFDSRGVRQGG